jgi:hypothetical protein
MFYLNVDVDPIGTDSLALPNCPTRQLPFRLVIKECGMKSLMDDLFLLTVNKASL